MLNYHQAVEEMHKGNVVKYLGTVNGNVWTDAGRKFCMCRGIIFSYDFEPIPDTHGSIVYDPDFRYELTGETVNTRLWPNKLDWENNEPRTKI